MAKDEVIPELIEWPYDEEWLSKHRKRRFMNRGDCRKYCEVQLAKYVEDNIYFRGYHWKWQEVFERGYLVPMEFLKRFGNSIDMRKKSLRERRELRERIIKEFARWHVHYKEWRIKRKTNFPRKVIIAACWFFDKIRLYEKLMEMFGVYRIYMYNPTGSPSGMRHYSGEAAVVIETPEYGTSKAMESIMERILNINVDAYIIVIDTVGFLKIKGYKEIDIADFVFPYGPECCSECYQDPYDYK